MQYKKRKTHYKLREQRIVCFVYGFASIITKQDYFSISMDKLKDKLIYRS